MGSRKLREVERNTRKMATDGVRIVVEFKKVKDPKKFREVFKPAIEATRKESGCRMYELFRGDEEDCFVMLEWWSDAAAIDAHLKTPHIQTLFAHLRELLSDQPDIRRFTTAGI